MLPSGGLLGVELGMLVLPSTSVEGADGDGSDGDQGQQQQQQQEEEEDGSDGSQVTWKERMRVDRYMLTILGLAGSSNQMSTQNAKHTKRNDKKKAKGKGKGKDKDNGNDDDNDDDNNDDDNDGDAQEEFSFREALASKFKNVSSSEHNHHKDSHRHRRRSSGAESQPRQPKANDISVPSGKSADELRLKPWIRFSCYLTIVYSFRPLDRAGPDSGSIDRRQAAKEAGEGGRLRY